MYFGQILFALIMAVLFTFVFGLILRRPGPWVNLWTFFLIVFLAAWAGSLWVSPAGPPFIGIFWLPIIFVAFFIAVLLAASAGPVRQPRVETATTAEQKEKIARAFNAFFWIMLIGLIIAILLGYLAGPVL